MSRVSAETRVGTLLETYLELVEVLAGYHPHLGGRRRRRGGARLAPPPPMVLVLERLDTLQPGETLEVLHDRRPLFLYPQLDARGFVHGLLSRPIGIPIRVSAKIIARPGRRYDVGHTPHLERCLILIPSGPARRRPSPRSRARFITGGSLCR
jgi:hypothetical protein